MSSKPASRFLDSSTPPHVFTLTFVAAAATLSMNVFLPSLPGMARYFDTDYRIVQLSVALYLCVNALMQIAVGPLSDRFGRRPVIMAGFAIYIFATLGCISAPTVQIFLGFRMLQAAVVVGVVLSRAAIRDMVPGDQAASMIGYVTMGMSIIPMIGPSIGGVLDQTFGWKANFWLQAGAGVAAILLTWRDLGETITPQPGGFSAQFRAYPSLLTSPRFWGYCASAALTSGAFFAYLGGAPFVGSEIYGMSPARLGLFFGTPAAGYLVGNYISGRYSMRIGLTSMVFWGAIITAAGLTISLALFLLGFGSEYVFFGFMTWVGVGNGMTLPNATSGMMSVRPELAGSASGLGGALNIGGGAALSALAGWLLVPGSTAMPLLLLMLASSALAVVAIVLVMQREKRLNL
ncbi:multidrug effflux MFS transporter [Aliiroseovarius sp. F47248L]|uniref:multidrug effflux MFS transporter n=1 Tax=Aliiroseovarius sp. F47248L TaxID=2926420 RepID=UPI001FF0EB8E|nr:multidrug effflux MFS transporter [Aliiroseovarius sp. F47248L]MCK0137787.1 multidrug effflux MFS transporter [Aliiroseovarius sp. F47248L]